MLIIEKLSKGLETICLFFSPLMTSQKEKSSATEWLPIRNKTPFLEVFNHCIKRKSEISEPFIQHIMVKNQVVSSTCKACLIASGTDPAGPYPAGLEDG